MKKSLKYAYILVLITGLGIIAVQSYWLLSVYKLISASLIRTANDVLSLAVAQTAISKQTGVDYNAGSGIPESKTIGIPKTMLPDENTPVTSTLIATQKSGQSLNIIITDSTGPAGVSGTRKTTSPVFINVNDSLLLRKIIHHLQRGKIDIPFRLSARPFKTLGTESHHVTYIFMGDSPAEKYVALDFPGIRWYALRNMIPELIISISIVVIAVVSFIYLIKTIYRQKRFNEMKNDFISNISHELKTPVAIMMAANEALVRYNVVNDKDKTERYIAINQNELIRIEHMLNQMLDTIKQESMHHALQLKSVNVDEVIRSIVNRFSTLDSVALHYESALESKLVLANEDALGTIISNLVDNAIKYNNKPCRSVWIESRRSANGILISVKDNGPGIEDRYLPYLFDKFYRVPKGNLYEVKGFGLGLSQVKELVQQMKGTIAIRSQNGIGTKFTINLQLNEEH